MALVTTAGTRRTEMRPLSRGNAPARELDKGVKSKIHQLAAQHFYPPTSEYGMASAANGLCSEFLGFAYPIRSLGLTSTHNNAAFLRNPIFPAMGSLTNALGCFENRHNLMLEVSHYQHAVALGDRVGMKEGILKITQIFFGLILPLC